VSIRITCPSCHKVYNLGETAPGKTLRCRECQSAIPVPAPAGQGRREDGRRPSDDRLTPPTQPASAARRARRDEEDEPRRPIRRRSHRKESGDSTKLWPTLLGVGAVGLVLVGLIIGGVALLPPGKGGSSQGSSSQGGSSVPAPGAGLEGDLAAMKGTWQSGPVTADGMALGTVKMSISPTAATEGRIALVIGRQTGQPSPSKSGTTFSLQQNGNERVLLTPEDYRRRRAIVLIYRFEGDQLVLTGKVAAGSSLIPLKDVAMRRTSADPETAQ
jgi:hypothetical protein